MEFISSDSESAREFHRENCVALSAVGILLLYASELPDLDTECGGRAGIPPGVVGGACCEFAIACCREAYGDAGGTEWVVRWGVWWLCHRVSKTRK